MKRMRVAALSLMLMLVMLAQIAQAAEPKAAGAYLDLSFEGTTAICSAVCRGDKSSDKVDVTLTLYQGDNYITSWNGSGDWKVTLSKRHKVTPGNVYRLELTYSINGTAKPAVSTTSECP